jgi:hypothetical protein
VLINDRRHVPCLIVTLLLGVVATGAYLYDAPRHLSGPSGSTAVGLTLGIAAYLIMLFLVALGLKRRVPHWRLGKAQSWLRWHIWLGILVPLLVGLHGAFRIGGTMTAILWALLAAVWFSGLLGLLLQQFLPGLMLYGIPNETVAQQWQREVDNLLIAAEGVVAADKRGKPKVEAGGVVLDYVGRSLQDAVPAFAPAEGQTRLDDEAIDGLIRKNEPIPGAEPLRTFYLEHAQAFLAGRGGLLRSRTQSEAMFESVRKRTPPHVHPGVDRLEGLCERRRQLFRQRRMMNVLMLWLMVHVPLSWTLVGLTTAHAVIALRYG